MSGNARMSDRTYRVSNFDSDGSPEPVLRLPRRGNAVGRGMHLSKSQLLILWSSLAGMMVLVFVIGFHAGHDQGREDLLEEVSREAVRLPIVSPIAGGPTTNDKSALFAKNASGTVGSKESFEETETTFDFAGSDAISSAKVETKEAPKTAKVKTKAVTKKSPPSESPSSKSLTGWFVQVEAAKSEKEIKLIKERFESKGFAPKIHTGKIRDKVYQQVVLGPYETREDAVAARGQVKASKLSRIEPFVRKF